MFVKFMERLHSVSIKFIGTKESVYMQEKISTLTGYVCYTNTKAVSFYRNTKMAAVKNRSIQMKPF